MKEDYYGSKADQGLESSKWKEIMRAKVPAVSPAMSLDNPWW